VKVICGISRQGFEMFCLRSGGFQLELEVVPVESLFPHEETLPELADKLSLEFKNFANLESPIIIDRSNVVLDGNHRLFVFKKLGFKYISVCRIDYLDDRAQLRYWFRLFRNIRDLGVLKRVVTEMNGDIEQVGDRDGLEKALGERHFSCGIQKQGLYALIHFGGDVVKDAVDAYAVLRKVQERLIRDDVTFDYIPCQYVYSRKFCEMLKADELIVWTPRITKDMLITSVKMGKVFAPKSTRHLIPARPLNVNVPSRWFKEDLSLKEINHRFTGFLENKDFRRVGPGQVVGGRYYGEDLFVFFDRKSQGCPPAGRSDY
jgi:hypothetical protein